MDKGDPRGGLWNKVDWRGSFLKSLERHEEGFVAPHQVGNPHAEGGGHRLLSSKVIEDAGVLPYRQPSVTLLHRSLDVQQYTRLPGDTVENQEGWSWQ